MIELLVENKEFDKLELYFNFFEEQMYNEGELYVQQVLSTILAVIGDEPSILRTAFRYMGPNTRKLSNLIEDALGRKRVVE